MFSKNLALVGLSVLTLSANAALYDRGNGMIYDDALNITWLQDANYAKTSGYDTNGAMTWFEANTWASSLSYAGFDNWRLPSIRGRQVTGTASSGELGYMFYINMDLNHRDSMAGNPSFPDATSAEGLSHFNNVQGNRYWYEDTTASNAYVFDLGYGFQLDVSKNSPYYSAWAVADSDIVSLGLTNISSVPIPAATYLFSSALIGLVGLKRK